MAKATDDAPATIVDVPEVALVEPASDTDGLKLQEFLAEKTKNVAKGKRRVAIFTHATPDPDAIGSQIALRHLLSTFGIDATCFVAGDISHPQNKITVQLLDPHLVSVNKYKAENFFLKILVDTIPSHAGTGDHDIEFDVVIDHHKELPDERFQGLCIHHHSGSCCGIINGMLEDLENEWDDTNEEHVKVATALLVGVITDTEFCTKPDTTKGDFLVQQNTFGVADSVIVRSIVTFEWPTSWVKLLGIAINEHELHDGIAVVGLGMLKADQHDAVASIADSMLSWKDVKTAVAFALFDGKYISGCLRTKDPTIETHSMCRHLGTDAGQGGGKALQGRYTKPLGAFAFETEEDKLAKERWWDQQREREMQKILRTLNQ